MLYYSGVLILSYTYIVPKSTENNGPTSPKVAKKASISNIFGFLTWNDRFKTYPEQGPKIEF